ncbi:integrating conjugative element protein [Congregibacter litoralis]|uniref:Integrating conjugative element protein family n=1 Tax=Congregibacter litoralis KT71 TaxID=314285 RepID=A4AE32_9GAMM|nr:integrating conjugative element protein [Congregibacter litoralis]EAQ95724.1 integrating conjugative element protein family [Congregibacter litoralis KT71]
MNSLSVSQWFFVGFGLWSVAAIAELSVIYDSGGTQPLAPYFLAFEDERVSAPIATSPNVPLGAADLSQLLPIRTPELTPGVVIKRTFTLADGVSLPRPFFLIGADPQSMEWFIEHRDRLAQIHAVGMLVNVETVADLDAIATIAEGLPILPASGTDIARSLALKHIPVLISRRGIEQ